MRWEDGRESDNIEDQRSSGGARRIVGGGIGTVFLVLVAMYFGVDPSVVLNLAPRSSNPPAASRQVSRSADENKLAKFVSVVLADTEDIWHSQFQAGRMNYREPKLVLFTGSVESACGFAQAATGPFYCPADEKVYIDLEFYQEMKDRFKAPGDFAQAYVIAHEVGHHVQKLLGISEKVQKARARVSQKEGNRLSVMLELQADCLAGVWANHADKARHILEQGDVEEALNAASAIGDDRLQKLSQGHVVPDAFTHGTSEQRVTWFKRGLETGEIKQCNTFNTGKN